LWFSLLAMWLLLNGSVALADVIAGALAVLACIITSTPGTAWAGYDPVSGLLRIHVLDLVDDATWVRTVKERYERRLMEIFE
jgi:multicomponent K+:H+ antiporter subunit E